MPPELAQLLEQRRRLAVLRIGLHGLGGEPFGLSEIAAVAFQAGQGEQRLTLVEVPPEKSPSTVSSVAAAMARAWSLSCQAAAWGAWQVAQVAEPTKPAASH